MNVVHPILGLNVPFMGTAITFGVKILYMKKPIVMLVGHPKTKSGL
jgi:hypothetical protein